MEQAAVRMYQSTADRLLGLAVTLATGVAIFVVQHQVVVYLKKRRSWKRLWKDILDYNDPFFRSRWDVEGADGLAEHRGRCLCGSFMFKIIAPARLKALDCPSKVRYPHIFIPAPAFQPTSDLRVLSLFTSTAAYTNQIKYAFCSRCGAHIFRASDSAVDTLIVNVDCLDPSTIDSLTVTYYEDLFAFPPSTKNAKPKGPQTCKSKASSSTSKSTSTPFNGLNGNVHKGTAANEGNGISETDLQCRGQTGGMTNLDVWARWSKAHQGYGVQSKIEVLSSYNSSAQSIHTSSNGHALAQSSKVFRCNNIQEVEEVIPSMDRMRYHLQRHVSKEETVLLEKTGEAVLAVSPPSSSPPPANVKIEKEEVLDDDETRQQGVRVLEGVEINYL